MQSSRPVRRAEGARTLVANRSTKICWPHNTASHRKRRAMTTNSTLLPDSGRSPTRRWYRLCTRREAVPQDGHAEYSFDARTVIVVFAESWTALTTTKPLGTNENCRND
jgi:hypothetical protein